MLYAQSYNLTWVLVAFLVGCFGLEELWCGEGESAPPSSSSQTRSVVPFTGHLLCMAWLRGSSPSSLTAGTRVGSGFIWFAVLRGWMLGPSQCYPFDAGEWLVLQSVSWERERESERGAGERELYNCIRLTAIFRTVLNYSVTGSLVL